MIIKTPEEYISGADVLKQAGEIIPRYSKHTLFIGSQKALDAAWETVRTSYDGAGLIPDEPLVFQGYPSERQFRAYAEKIKRGGYDAVAVFGGGRAVDTAKAAAELADVPVITIPTIAATCAAWAALTVQYDDEGSFVQMRPLKRTPVCIIADTRIIMSAPVRYLYAGVVDTFAKLYENTPSIEKNPDSICLNISVYAAQLAFDRLKAQTDTAVLEAGKGIFGQAAKDVADAVIYIAGFVGSFDDGRSFYSFAHPFYHDSARIPSTRTMLHGEKVAFGIIAQHFLNGKDEAYIRETAALFDHYNNLFTLEDIGLDEAGTDFIKHDVKEAFPFVVWPEEDIKKALTDADLFVKAYKKEVHGK